LRQASVFDATGEKSRMHGLGDCRAVQAEGCEEKLIRRQAVPGWVAAASPQS
jgi:hypothetical protein